MLTRLRVPDPYRLVLSARSERFAVRRIGGGIHKTDMPPKSIDQTARFGVPEPRRVVHPDGGDSLAVRRKGNVCHVALMSKQRLKKIPVCAFQSQTPKPEAAASVLPSGENATEDAPSERSSSVRRCAPVLASQSRAVLSPPPVASVLPSGEKATARTSSDAWPAII